MSDQEKESLSNNSHPKIIHSEEKEIFDRKPPNEKILYFNLVSNNNIKSKNEDNTT